MGKVGAIKQVEVADLVPYERNARVHDRAQVEKLKKSIREFGFLSPCLVDKDLNIIAGHGRVMAAKELGLEADVADTEPVEIIERAIRPFRKVHYLITCDVDEHDRILAVLDQLRGIGGVEIDSSLN